MIQTRGLRCGQHSPALRQLSIRCIRDCDGKGRACPRHRPRDAFVIVKVARVQLCPTLGECASLIADGITHKHADALVPEAQRPEDRPALRACRTSNEDQIAHRRANARTRPSPGLESTDCPAPRLFRTLSARWAAPGSTETVI
jgi:hypothetical protein